MPLTKDQKEKIEELSQALVDLVSSAKKTEARRVRRQILSILGAATSAEESDRTSQITEAAEPADGETAIADFFGDVGEGLIDAQSKLDELSAQYIARSRDRKHVQPSVFRVPKVTGSLKVGLSKMTDKRMGLLLFSTREQAEQHQEHEISFEMVSAPPPPEAVEELARLDSTFHPVLAAGARQLVRRHVTHCLADDDGAGKLEDAIVGTSSGKRHAQIAFASPFERVLVYARAAGDYFLIARYGEVAGQLPALHYGVWQLTVGEDGASVLTRVAHVPNTGARKGAFAAADAVLHPVILEQVGLLGGNP